MKRKDQIIQTVALLAGLIGLTVWCIRKGAWAHSILISLGIVVIYILFMDISKMENIRENYIAEQIDSGNNSVDYFALPTDYIYDYWRNNSSNVSKINIEL